MDVALPRKLGARQTSGVTLQINSLHFSVPVSSVVHSQSLFLSLFLFSFLTGLVQQLLLLRHSFRDSARWYCVSQRWVPCASSTDLVLFHDSKGNRRMRIPTSNQLNLFVEFYRMLLQNAVSQIPLRSTTQ